MEYGIPLLLFAIGFLAAFLASRGWRINRNRDELKNVQVKDGFVRVDALAGVSSTRERFKGTSLDVGCSPVGSSTDDDLNLSSNNIGKRS